MDLTEFLDNSANMVDNSNNPIGGVGFGHQAIVKVTQGKQNLQYSRFGSTMFSYDIETDWATYYNIKGGIQPEVATTSDATLLSKSLEASNTSMTQSVPELSLAQKLFSALTKVLQTTQTNVDAIINTIR